MGTQTIPSHERSRTYWTPVMERYFIDLMLEQLHRGNRSGHTFNKQAWTDMLTMFNTKFGSQYDKDVLKSRYTNLWKQFNDVKHLLGHDGFSWDEGRQMVIADDHVWDIYIQVHPDARSYKTKAVLNFSDLCLIYGYTNADGRYSRSSHDIDFDDEIQAVNTVSGDAIGCVAPPDRPRTDWTPEMDQYFIELMLDQVGRGNKVSNTFNKQAWTDMLALFNAKFGPQHGKRVLRHRFKKLWKYYCDIMNLLQQNGFCWDEVQQMVVADDDIWDAYVKTHPFARSYRTKELPNYYDLVLIYGNVIDSENQNHLHLDKNLPNDISEVKGVQTPSEFCHKSIMHLQENQMPTVSDRTRTYWTPPMDRYLIDLLLEQVNRGNKIGQTFVSHAWIDMVTTFNAQFRAHHDKDVLKNRYKHLRRLYNEIKILLEQRGFSWDENREIVTADDHVWDAYTKDHPVARSYRVKTVPSYHKLCFIFGEESSDRRYSRLAHDTDPSNEVPVLMTDERKNDQVPAGPSPMIDWTPQMDRAFIDLMLEHSQEGSMFSQAFSEQAWSHVIISFNERFKLQCGRSVLEDRYLWWMKQYGEIYNLLNHGGFMWNESQQLITAEDDLWEAYGKERPDALLYKDKFLGYYTDLCKIFGNVIDKEVNSRYTGEIDNENMEIKMDGNEQHLLLTSREFQISQQRKRPAEMISLDTELSKKVHRTENDVQKALSEMAGVVTRLVSMRQHHNYKAGEGAIDALQAIPDIDDELMLDACDLLEDERKAKTFMALDATLRKKWLLRKLRSQ
ncbi:L10-interacting MYB domain-containing protein isoform X1 [Cucurbita maxima]|uniref:L10-interacting MYB domain-containing protein isoform X1 n=1 Tax=Cucurbita maxima TaxID=3661 RepID=A0A6J1IH70_CUCMA|nr:L10-interacting MYB domain-containing protein isoform X1 [Cucurbita maxima]